MGAKVPGKIPGPRTSPPHVEPPLHRRRDRRRLPAAEGGEAGVAGGVVEVGHRPEHLGVLRLQRRDGVYVWRTGGGQSRRAQQQVHAAGPPPPPPPQWQSRSQSAGTSEPHMARGRQGWRGRSARASPARPAIVSADSLVCTPGSCSACRRSRPASSRTKQLSRAGTIFQAAGVRDDEAEAARVGGRAISVHARGTGGRARRCRRRRPAPPSAGPSSWSPGSPSTRRRSSRRPEVMP